MIKALDNRFHVKFMQLEIGLLYQILFDSEKYCLNYMGFKYWINTNPSCDVTIFVKGVQNAQLSFCIFAQDFQDFESSYLRSGSTY